MKKIHLFILLQIVWISLFVIGILYFNKPDWFGPANVETRTIKIMNGDPENGHLILDPDTTVIVKPGWKVEWVIDSSSNVNKFHIKKKPGSSEIFNRNHKPPSRDTTRESGIVGNYKERTYSYDIKWKIKGYEKQYTFDPKLAINPVPFFPPPFISIFAGLIFLFSLLLLQQKKKKVR